MTDRVVRPLVQVSTHYATTALVARATVAQDRGPSLPVSIRQFTDVSVRQVSTHR